MISLNQDFIIGFIIGILIIVLIIWGFWFYSKIIYFQIRNQIDEHIKKLHKEHKKLQDKEL